MTEVAEMPWWTHCGAKGSNYGENMKILCISP